jgi:tetratricopeptide (TPR) repeat protein
MSQHQCSGKSQCSNGGCEETPITEQLTTLESLLQDLREEGNKMGEAEVLHSMSSCYFAQAKYDTALNVLQQSLAIVQEESAKEIEADIISNIAQVYNTIGEYDKAMEHLEKAIIIQDDIKDTTGLCSSLFNMGHLFLQKKDTQNAVITWLSLYRFAKDLALVDVLQELESLATKLGLPDGNKAWEKLLETVEKK